MTKEQIVALAVKLFAVFLLIYGLGQLASIIPLSYYDNISVGAWITIAGLGLFFAGIILFLWFFPLFISRKLLPSDEVKEGESIASVKDIDVIAFSILGLWVLASAVPDMVYWILMWMTVLSKSSGDAMLTEQVINTTVTVLEIIIGVWLLVGARGLRGLLRRMRYAGS